jgi:transcriptional regulator with XRE-family HTH domain
MTYMHTARAAVLTFGRSVRACRLAAGISQVELGRRSRVTSKFIGEIERGTSNPSLETMLLVAHALKCDLAQLLQAERSSLAYVLLRADDVRRAQEAVAVMASVLARRKRSRRAS